MIFAGKNHEIEWKYKDFEQNFLQDDQGCSLISSGTRWLKSKKFFFGNRAIKVSIVNKKSFITSGGTISKFFLKIFVLLEFSGIWAGPLESLKKKLCKFVETALYALRRKKWCKNFFWKIRNTYFSFRFRDKKFTTGLCEFHSTCTEENLEKNILWKNS